MTTLHQGKLHSQTLPERDAVLTELRRILSSVHFCNSRRYPAFLQYVVAQALAGNAGLLKERTIGVEVFDRPATYDTNADTVVRFTAGEVRKRLAAYYHDVGRTSGLRISLPAGSYVPDFIHEPAAEHLPGQNGHVGPERSGSSALPYRQNVAAISEGAAAFLAPEDEVSLMPVEQAPAHRRHLPSTRQFVISGSALVVILIAFVTWRWWPVHVEAPLDSFWQPVLHDRGTILLCAGGNVFAPRPTPEFITADKETDYPYFSLQTATSITQLSSFIERSGATPEFDFAASTPLPELHSHAIILLNAYNNQWTLRLVEPLRFYFSPKTALSNDEGIVDRTVPGIRWRRDLSLPYSNTDDYALMARFWDTTTDNWVLVLAGLGRNGTEAASQFVTDPQYMKVLQDRIQKDLSKGNIEVVLKVNVIDGKTGPPSIVATQVW